MRRSGTLRTSSPHIFQWSPVPAWVPALLVGVLLPPPAVRPCRICAPSAPGGSTNAPALLRSSLMGLQRHRRSLRNPSAATRPPAAVSSPRRLVGGWAPLGSSSTCCTTRARRVPWKGRQRERSASLSISFHGAAPHFAQICAQFCSFARPLSRTHAPAFTDARAFRFTKQRRGSRG